MNGYQKFARPPVRRCRRAGTSGTASSAGTRYYDYDLYVNGDVVHRGEHAPRPTRRRWRPSKAVQLIRELGVGGGPDLPAARRARAAHRGAGGSLRQLRARPDPGATGRGRLRARPPAAASVLQRAGHERQAAVPELGARGSSPAETNHVRRRWRCALASLKGVDRGVAQVYRAIKHARPARAHGVHLHLGQRAVLRRAPDREGEGAPLPGGAAPAARDQGAQALPERPHAPVRSVARPVANIDLAPTILSLAHARPCPPSGPCRTMDGRSLMPLLKRSGKLAKAPRDCSPSTRPRDPGQVRHLPVRRDPHPRGDLRGALAGRRPGHAASACPADQVERYDLQAGPVRAPQPLLRGQRRRTARSTPPSPSSSRGSAGSATAPGFEGATSGWTAARSASRPPPEGPIRCRCYPAVAGGRRLPRKLDPQAAKPS